MIGLNMEDITNWKTILYRYYSVAVHVLKLYKLRPSPTQNAMAWMWQGARARTRATNSIPASDNCHRLLKTQGTVGSQFDNPTEVSMRVHSSWLAVVSAAELSRSRPGRCSSRFIFSFLPCTSLLLRRCCRVWINLSAIDIVNHWIHLRIPEYTTTCAYHR